MKPLRFVRGTFVLAGLLLAAGCASDLTEPTALTQKAPSAAASIVTNTSLIVRPSSQGGAANNLFGVPADAAATFSVGSIAANATVAGAKSEMYLPAEALFGGREITLGDVASISYWTKTGSTHAADPRDWFLAIYTKPYAGDVSTPTWYGDRIGSEPYFSSGISDPANTWNEWSTGGPTNKLRFFESTAGAPGATFGSYADPDWATFVAGNALSGSPYASRKILSFSLQTGSAWANGFTGRLDGLRITLTDGSVATVNFEPDAPPCSAICYADAVTGNDANSGAAPNEAKKTIQAAINQVSAGGAVHVLPGTYDETAPNSAPTSLGGTYQFGLFFGSGKPGITLMGVTAGDVPITNAAATQATITTNATNNFGASGIFVEAVNTTIQGVTVGPNIPGDNKTIEVVADNFTLQYAATTVPGGGAVYIGEFDPPAGSILSYHILNNRFNDATQIALSSGAGQTGAASGREIKGNSFDLGGNNWPAISFNGSGGVPWFTKTVGGAVITGNSFSGGTPQYVRARGTYIETQFDWQSYWNNNTYDKAAVALVTESPFDVRSFSYVSGPYTFSNVRRIGSTIQGEVDNSAAGGEVLVKAGTYAESPLVNHSLTLKSQSGKLVTTIALQSGPTYTGALTLDGSGSNITVDGFTIQGFDAVGAGLASSNIYVRAGLGNVSVKNNRIRVGNVGGGSNGDDGIGLLTDYNPSSVTPSLTVDGNSFEPVGSAAPRAFYVNPSVNLFSFRNNTITGRFDGISISQAMNATVENNSVTGVGSAGSRSGGLGTWGYPDMSVWGHATFRGNTISGTRGIRLYQSSNVTIEKNLLSGNKEGVYLDPDSDPLTIQTHRNSITGSDDAGVNNTTLGITSATCNWWGASNGPGSVGSGSGDKVSTLVTFSQWLVTSDLNGACGDTQGPLTALTPPAPAPINTAIALGVSISDLTTGNSPLKSYTWTRDGGSPTTVTFGSSAVTQGFTLNIPADAAADVDNICVQGTDIWDNVGPLTCVLAVWYDPNAGFVTGGGWINSPLGAYAPNPSLTGKANFGFVSKYERGRTLPSGNTEFQFNAASLNFKSTSMEWLVVSGAKAQYKGAGTINGTGDYRFMLTAIDGQVSGGGGSDKFRIRIWNNVGGGLVYDNQLSAPDGADPTTVIGGGSIVLHR